MLPLQAQWLVERSAEAGYSVIVVSAWLSGWGATWSYGFSCPTKPRGRRNLSVAAHFVGYGGGGEKGKMVQILRKCNAYRG